MHIPVHRWVWPTYLVLALVFLGAGNPIAYGLIVPVVGLVMALAIGVPVRLRRVDRLDLVAVGVLYVAVVALFALAFRVFTQDRVAGLFLAFAAGMLLGVVGPVVYTVWMRHRPLADLGLTRVHLRQAAALGLLLAAVQFALTLWAYPLPSPEDWVPLAVLALTVGLFEAVFFRGFIQSRLEESFGRVIGVGGAALLYAVYHVGYGMGAAEMVFLFGLGVVYAVAYATVRNLLVIWPLLTPLGAFYNNLESGDIVMPWAAILGFADVLALMATAVWLAARHERRAARPAPTKERRHSTISG